MTGTGNRSGTATSDVTPEQAEAVQPSGTASPGARRPYYKPALRQLGSVRDLTFGSPIIGVNDAMGGRVMLM